MELFIGNLHIIPFLCSFFVGFLFLVLSPLKYLFRTGSIPTNLGLYNAIERKLLIWGMIFGALGVLGSGVMTETLGYKYSFTDIDGTVSIMNSRDRK